MSSAGPVDSPPASRPRLYVMVGLPAAGKTTLARELEAKHSALRLTPDEWMIPLFAASGAGGPRDVLEGRFVWLADRALRVGVSVILDFGVWTKDERSALRSLAIEAGADCDLVYLAIDDAEQKRRVTNRFAAAPGSTFTIRPAELEAYREQFEVPDERELASGDLDPPPVGHATWRAWTAVRWPTSA
jgi:predicted kinase